MEPELCSLTASTKGVRTGQPGRLLLFHFAPCSSPERFRGPQKPPALGAVPWESYHSRVPKRQGNRRFRITTPGLHLQTTDEPYFREMTETCTRSDHKSGVVQEKNPNPPGTTRRSISQGQDWDAGSLFTQLNKLPICLIFRESRAFSWQGQS